MTRSAPRYCSECGILLPGARKAYGELEGGWAVEHEGGGAHNVYMPAFTGRVLCPLCFDAHRPPKSRRFLRAVCDECCEAPVRLRQISHAWTQLPATKSVHDARYGPLALCEPCWLKRMQGEQLALFDG